ncbi:MAG: hypothetical protein ABL999_09835 [Pyrinomonadaceae bacterium]
MAYQNSASLVSSPRSGRQHKAQGVSPGKGVSSIEPANAGDRSS